MPEVPHFGLLLGSYKACLGLATILMCEIKECRHEY